MKALLWLVTGILVAGASPASAAERDAYSPAAAFGKDIYLLAWQSGRVAPGDLRDGAVYNGDIVACRVDAKGKVLDAEPFVICAADDLQEEPQLASDGEVFLAVWQDIRNGKDWDVYAARVTPEGKVLDPDGFPVSGGKHNQARPRVVWDGKAFVVVWQDFRSGRRYEVRTARVSTEGKVLDPGGVRVASGRFYHCYAPAAASAGSGKSFVLHIALGLPVFNYRAPRVQGWFITDGKPAPTPAYVFDKKMKDARNHGPSGNGQPIAMAAGGGAFLAAWKTDTRQGRGGGPRASNAALFDANGKRTANLVLAGVRDRRLGRGGHIMDPDVAWDGTEFVVAWYEYARESRNACPSDVVFAARVGTDGKTKGKPVRLAGRLKAPASEPAAATDGAGTTLVAYEQHPETADVPIRIAFRMLRTGAAPSPPRLIPVARGPVVPPPEPKKPKLEVRKPKQFGVPVWHPNARWRVEKFAGCGVSGHLDGPRLEMEDWSRGTMSRLYRPAGAGRYVYSAYDPATERAHEVAGGAQGYLDGPFSRARFGGWDYVVRSRGARSPDGRYLYRTDGYNGHALRCLDLKAQTVKTLLPGAKEGIRGLVAGGRGLYVLKSGGQLTLLSPKGKAELGPKLEQKESVHRWGASLALDEKHGRIYATTYATKDYYVWYWDLKDGSFHGVLPTPKKSGKNRGRNKPGPFEGTSLYSEGSVFFGPDDPEKRFLYVGRVDTWNLFRLDLEKRVIAALDQKGGRRGEPRIVWFSDRKMGGRVPCYGGASWMADGSFQSTVHSPYVTWRFRRIK